MHNYANARQLGSYQSDAFQDHYHYLPTSTGEGASSLEPDIRVVIRDNDTANSNPGTFANKDSIPGSADNAHFRSGIVRTYRSSLQSYFRQSTETRSENVALAPRIVAF